MSQPAVSIVLPAYNAAAWLGDAVDSLLRQSFGDFELLVIDDGSSDATAGLLGRYADDRVRVLKHDANRGLIASLNHGLEVARGALIARMDADDVAHPRRLELQVAFLAAHSEVGICGTWFRSSGARWRTVVRTPVGHEEIAARLFFRSAFGHPTVMLRRAFLERNGLAYDPQARNAEDFDLWVRARDLTRLANLPRALLEYRTHPEQLSVRQVASQADTAARIRLRQLAMLLPQASEDEKRLHLQVCDGRGFVERASLIAARSWLDLLEAANRKAGMFPPRAFGEALANTWFICCLGGALEPFQLLRIYLSRSYSGLAMERLREHFVVAGRALLRPAAG